MVPHSIKPRKILHFDINGTITPVDTTEEGNKLENANMVVAKSIYGQLNKDGKWEAMNNDNLYMSIPGFTISYYNYLKSRTKYYKQLSYDFTNSFEGIQFAHFIPKLLESMESFLFPSFLKVLEMYDDSLIVFRTFGLDADEVIEYLKTNPKTCDKFKNFITGQFSYSDNIPILTLETGDIYTGMDEINELYRTTNSHLALKESYEYWNSSGRSNKTGKQIKGCDDLVQLFFDDNLCVNIIDDKNVTSYHINTLLALTNDDYYCKFINDIF